MIVVILLSSLLGVLVLTGIVLIVVWLTEPYFFDGLAKLATVLVIALAVSIYVHVVNVSAAYVKSLKSESVVEVKQ